MSCTFEPKCFLFMKFTSHESVLKPFGVLFHFSVVFLFFTTIFSRPVGRYPLLEPVVLFHFDFRTYFTVDFFHIAPYTTKWRHTKFIFALLIITVFHISFDVSTKYKYQTAKVAVAWNTDRNKGKSVRNFVYFVTAATFIFL